MQCLRSEPIVKSPLILGFLAAISSKLETALREKTVVWHGRAARGTKQPRQSSSMREKREPEGRVTVRDVLGAVIFLVAVALLLLIWADRFGLSRWLR